MKVLFLTIILTLGLFFRIYKFESLYTFDHDQDLSAWIVKDILVNHHPRLIGQLTSIDGVFIGPLYYYVLAFFFAAFNMNPLAAHIPVTVIGLASIASLYFVFKKFFGQTAGIVGAFLYATSTSLVFLDRWIVPTIPTVLWSVWLLYVLFSLLKGNFKTLPLAAILIGLIWHIHVALLPLVLLIPTAIFLSGKKIKLRRLILPLFIFAILSSPFIAFETRHGFGQIKGMYQAISYSRQDQPEGIQRAKLVISGASSAFSRVIFYQKEISQLLTVLAFSLGAFFLIKSKFISKNQLILLALWVALNIISQQLSKRDVSEYYFNNLIVISLLILSGSITLLIREGGIKQLATYILLTIFLIQNLSFILRIHGAGDGYEQKRDIIKSIKTDVDKNGYSCIGINYIAGFGKGVGFRYLSWQNGLNVVAGSTSVPVYNVVIPTAALPSERKFGGIGLIIPKENSYIDQNVCADPNSRLQPMLNYTD